MKVKGLFFSLLIFCSGAGGQNLFPNGGFEQYVQCPTYTSQIERCADWDSCLGTADFYHCNYYGWSTIGNYGIPSTGSGVIGLAASVSGPWSTDPNRFYGETFSAQLGAVLQPGATYSIKADMLYNTVQFPPPGPCLQLGFYFYKSGNPPVVAPGSVNYNPYSPQVGINANLIPVGTYGTFTFNYTPDSCFDRVMVGVFSNDSTFGTTCYNSGSGTFYFDMDNISMVQTAPPPQRITTAVSSAQLICVGECIDYSATSNLPVYSWNWDFGGSTTPASAVQNPQNICYPQAGTFDARMIATYECSADTVYLWKQIKVENLPRVEITYDSTVNCFGEATELYADGTGVISWSTGHTGINIRVLNPGSYIAYSTVRCGVASDTAVVEFENCPCTVFLPNAFSPDEDGLNDHFKAEGDCTIEDFQLDIYDRWGKRIFSATDIHSAWDGNYNGEVCQQGVYGFTLQYKGYTDYRLQKIRKSGYLTLLR